MNKTTAIKYILNRLECGLPRAIDIYNYLTAFGEINATQNEIDAYIKKYEED